MIKETNTDLFKVTINGTSTYKTIERDDEMICFVKDLLSRDDVAIKKISRPTTLEDMTKMVMLEGTDCHEYSTGGGFRTAQCEYDGKIYTIENQYPLCMTIYRKTENVDDQFMDENMIESFDVNTKRMGAMDRNIYEYLIKLMSD